MSNNQPVSLFSPDVSTEIWGCIVAHLKLLDRYCLSITCKAMWATVKCIPYPEFATIDSSKNTLGSFHFATLTSIRISGSNIDYNKLKMILSAIKHLARIDLSSISVTERSATRIVLSIPRVYRPHTIIIFAKGSESDRFKNAAAYMKERGVILQCKRLLEEEEEAEEEATLAGIRRRRIRTPSPLRGDVGDLRKQIDEMKDVFGAINDNPRAIVPTAIESLVAQHQYVDIQSLVQGDLGHEEPVNVNLAHTAAKAMAPRFLEGVAISSKGSCIFITEVEVYLRASSTIDDCANNTITVGFPENPVFAIEQKREFTNQWLEAKTYYGKFEFLVTGCVYGKVNSTEVQAVLGASLGKADINHDYWRVYVPTSAVSYVQDVRLLRNFTKLASGYKWRFKTKRFHDQGFSSASAVSIYSDNIAAVGSCLLRMKVEKVEDTEELVSLLKCSRELKHINFRKINSRGSKKALQSLSLSKGKKLAVNIAVMVLRDHHVEDSQYLEMYKSLIASRMKALNAKAIKENKYQCRE